MNYKYFILILGSLLITINGSKCKKVINSDAVYIFDDLQTKEYKQILNETSTLYFRFCQPILKCPEITFNTFAVIINNEGKLDQQCISLINTDSYFADSFELINQDKSNEGVQAEFNNTLNGFYVKYVLYCQDQQEGLKILDISYDKNKQFYTIEMEADNGCPLVLFSQIVQFLNDNNKFLSAILIMIGLTECLMGKQILKPTLFIFGYLIGFFFALYISSEIDLGDNPFFLWLTLIIAVLIGAFAGGLSMHLDKIGIVAIGIGLGVVLSLLLWNALLVQFVTSQYLLYSIMLVFSFGCTALSFRLFDHLIIFSTSFLGSYLVFKGIGLIAGGFPSEIKNISGNSDYRYYIYFTGIIILACSGIYYQYKQWGQKIITYDEIVQSVMNGNQSNEVKDSLLNDPQNDQDQIELKEIQEKSDIKGFQ
ncbi:unnamed protein product (macronuclear) [Paramecium tetraurelia]|uniref:Transmembrane protein 198 n=1 Tax=Paramecium tetraurelia TaxID=5888 RepID=A0D0V5_PARTE|nr:uncharacterized protein GSPATT00012224001 [Paramecium tetraurelia]CAK76672.1 unnamed protein product [Paramecium tetraurelia]|eukprot:XP_001444069.1 hypothetical protein (macronuclear) [Paramecium tetraurelia strain d4-2]